MMMMIYDTVLRGIADRLVPQHSIRRPACRLSPWFDAECRTQRRQCRRLELQYRKTGISTDRRFWIDAIRRRILLHRCKKEEYWRDRLELAVWEVIDSALALAVDVAWTTSGRCQRYWPYRRRLCSFFVRKVESMRSDTARLPPPPVIASATSSLASFRPCTQSEIQRIIMTSLVKSCSLDPVPTFLVREYVDVLLPYITRTVPRLFLAVD